MLKRKQKTFMSCIGVCVGIVVMLFSGLAFAQDVLAPPPSAIERSSNQEPTVLAGQECCQCAQDIAAFDEMVAEACRERYHNEGVENPTETQLNDCMRKLKADVLENCSEATKRAAAGDDRDWDGVPDDQDNCPDVPNPQQAQTDPNIKVNGKCRFIDNGDSTVTDVPNRRDWLKNANSAGRPMSWDEANDYCQGLNVVGSGWRLPDRQEFGQLLTREGLGSGHPFTNVQNNWYWISVEGPVFNVRTRVVRLPASGSDVGNSYVWPVRNTTTN
jgi:hypothetical protein